MMYGSRYSGDVTGDGAIDSRSLPRGDVIDIGPSGLHLPPFDATMMELEWLALMTMIDNSTTQTIDMELCVFSMGSLLRATRATTRAQEQAARMYGARYSGDVTGDGAGEPPRMCWRDLKPIASLIFPNSPPFTTSISRREVDRRNAHDAELDHRLAPLRVPPAEPFAPGPPPSYPQAMLAAPGVSTMARAVILRATPAYPEAPAMSRTELLRSLNCIIQHSAQLRAYNRSQRAYGEERHAYNFCRHDSRISLANSPARLMSQEKGSKRFLAYASVALFSVWPPPAIHLAPVPPRY